MPEQEASKVRIGMRFSSKSSKELRLTSRDPRSEDHKEKGLVTLTPSPGLFNKHFSKTSSKKSSKAYQDDYVWFNHLQA